MTTHTEPRRICARAAHAATFCMLALAALLLPGRASAQWATNGNDINNTNPGKVGIGTTTPSTKLDVAGVTKSDGFNLINTAAEKSFVVLWNNGVANQKVQVYWPASTQVDGIYEITVTGHYWYSNSNGGIRKRIVINGRNIGIINMEQSEVPFRLGFTGNSDTISDIMWDSTNSRYYFIVSNLDNAQNGITIHVKSITPAQTASNADTLNVTPIYTTDATVYPQLQTSIMGSNVGIGTNTPGYKLDVQGGQINASGGFCIAGDCKTSWSQVAGGNGGTQWTTAGTSVYYNSGNVGVGTASPVRPFHVDLGSLTSNGTRISRAAAANSPYFDFMLDTTGTPYGFISAGDNLAYRNIALAPFGGNVGIGTTSPNQKLGVQGMFGLYPQAWIMPTARGMFMFHDGNGGSIYAFNYPGGTGDPIGISASSISFSTYTGGTGNQRVTIANSGDVGIGTAAPTSARLHLYSPANTYLRIGAPLANQSSIAFNDDTNGQDIVLYRPEGTRDFVVWTATAGNAMRVMQSGSVGVGTNTPGYKFDVQGGQVNASGGLCIAGDCKTAWSQVGGQWTTNGSNIYFNTGNVGIGTTSPGASLDVAGNPANAIRTSYLTISASNTGATDRPFIRGTTTHLVINGYGTNTGGTLYLNYPGDLAAGQTTNTRVQETLFVSATGNGGNGNVGVGTATPGSKLTVSVTGNADGIAVDGTTNPNYSLKTSGTTRGYLATATTASGYAVGSAPGDLILRTEGGKLLFDSNAGSGTPAMTIAGANGNVGVGTIAPAAKLDVNGNVSVTGNITATGNIAAKYQDVAEWVPSAQKLQAGTVVVLDSARNNHVVASGRAYDTAVAGVVSDSPGVILGEGGEGKLKVATTGRVKVKVDATRAPIKVGDLLVSSDVEGLAMKSVPVDLGGTPIHRPGTIIGKALEPLEKGTGEILVLLSLQ